MKRSSIERIDQAAGLECHQQETSKRRLWFLHRRALLARLLAWGSATVLPSVFPVGSSGAGTTGYGINTPVTMPGGPPDRTRAGLFEDQLESRFWIVPDPKSAAPRVVVLNAVDQSETTVKPRRKGLTPTPRFSLIFRDASIAPLPQGTYRVEHAQLGTFPLFLVPIGPKQTEVRYQAIFA